MITTQFTSYPGRGQEQWSQRCRQDPLVVCPTSSQEQSKAVLTWGGHGAKKSPGLENTPCCAVIEHSGFLKPQQAETEAGPTVCPFR